MISKHFFEHRYDYRAEWLRFTATLGQFGERAGDGAEGGEDGGDLHRRVAKALAELTGSPGALLLVPDGQGGFRAADRWRWTDAGEGEGRAMRRCRRVRPICFRKRGTSSISTPNARASGRGRRIWRFPTGCSPIRGRGWWCPCCISSG